MHRTARTPPLGDPRRQAGRYSAWPVYGETKLANLLFTYELDRRCRDAELPVKALAAHPGFAGTHLAANGQYGRAVRRARLDPRRGDQGGRPVRALRRAADADGGDRRPARARRTAARAASAQTRGLPAVVDSTRLSHDEHAQRDAVGAQRAHRRSRVPLTKVRSDVDLRPMWATGARSVASSVMSDKPAQRFDLTVDGRAHRVEITEGALRREIRWYVDDELGSRRRSRPTTR